MKRRKEVREGRDKGREGGTENTGSNSQFENGFLK
jgi:hypothetical protein